MTSNSRMKKQIRQRMAETGESYMQARRALENQKRIVCPDCGMSTWIDGEGCALPGCENFRILIDSSEEN